MKIDVEKLSNVERKVAVEVPWEMVKEELDLAYRGLAKRAKVKGFRAGHVPRKVLEQYYGRAVEGEVLQRLVDDGFRRAVREKELFPISTPVVDGELKLEMDAPFRFEAKVEVKPEVIVSNYKGLDVVRQVREVSDVEVERELSRLREKAVLIEQVTDRNQLKKGDLAVIDFFGYIGGQTFKGGKGINYTVELGAGQMIAGFEDQLVGLEIGKEKTFSATYPKDEGPEEARGKQVEWKVDLKEIKRKVVPALDDEFAKDLGDYETLAALKDGIRENLKTRETARTRRQLREKVLEKLVGANTVDIPKVMVERQLDHVLSELTQMAKKNNDPKIMEAIIKLRVENRPKAEQQVGATLLLEAVAREEKITISDAELEGRLSELAREHRMNVKQLRAQLEQQGQIEALRMEMRQDRALNLVVESAKVKDEVATGPIEDDPMDPDHQGHDHDHDDHDHPHDHDHDHDHSHHDHDHDHP